ncbi:MULTISPECIES: chorismate mutase [Meiothermus]|jgi:chorismate mutase|uniref:chorismate mutase n=3 Tax=Meiothermus TaxID=65551 RepID=D3PRN0_MEIRD|nr:MULTISPECIES: chorismate mutase [Meiothermus]ADD28113.1 chorismate mutase [Meiothermus ruber DSM 1279]AGK04583.1 chorismate mutase [Meiothermus ruber DSM 1279]AWR86863.1 chorismate mutase [Meiothermus taiwanensis WR-220]KIQ55032.1 chorismate mutase [Meiothermus taiwanensis]KZK14759.1 chorismate mutase [Meiothermus taiwanensis]
MMRGVRGAITVEEDSREAILSATRELLQKMLEVNQITDFDSIGAMFFTLTDDLRAAFPAEAARQLGMQMVPLINSREIPVPGALPRVIRVMMLWNTDLPQKQVKHVYLREAVRLRPDLESAQ